MEIYNRYASLMGTLRKKYGVGPARLPVMAKGLSEVMEAIRAQDAEKAGQLVSKQCDLAKRDLLELMARARDEEESGVSEPAEMSGARPSIADLGGSDR